MKVFSKGLLQKEIMCNLYVCMCVFALKKGYQDEEDLFFSKDYTEKGKKSGSLRCWGCGRFPFSCVSNAAKSPGNLGRLFPLHSPGGQLVSSDQRGAPALRSHLLLECWQKELKNQGIQCEPSVIHEQFAFISMLHLLIYNLR